MAGLYEEGIGEGAWVLWKGERYWLSAVSKEQLQEFKETSVQNKMNFLIEKEGEKFSVNLSEIEIID